MKPRLTDPIFVPSSLEQAICLAAWYVLLLLFFGGAWYIISSLPADAMTLSIQGHSTGTGYQNLTFAGDLLNVSLAQNGSAWNLSLQGAA